MEGRMAQVMGKVALVTGGGTGIGKGIATRFAEEGMKIAVAGLEQARVSVNQYGGRHLGGYSAAQALARTIGKDAIAIEADVADPAAVEAMMARTVERFGQVDVVVNAAGVITVSPIAEMSEEEWDSVMDVNVKGTFLVNKAAVIQMRAQGGGGRIINLSSVSGKFGEAMLTHYCASKFAVVGFTNALAKEVAREGITVNCICPGIVGTQMWTMLKDAFGAPGEAPEETYARAIEHYIPQGEPQSEEDMADMALYLVGAPHVTGQAFNVDGGAAL
jgi:meso-butanediol dehydrogenase/(S,S)-butanediol dehydrogenase/diacetyl reductase